MDKVYIIKIQSVQRVQSCDTLLIVHKVKVLTTKLCVAQKGGINKLAKTSAAPKNFYTAAQATKRLGIPKTTFFHYVRTGKIRKVVPPGQVEGYYPKTDIDKMAKERELFILEYASEPSTFARASEGDIRGIYDLCVSLFGVTGTPSYELMLAWQRKNPLTYYVVKQEDIITGYIGFLYLNEEATRYIMSESVPGVPSPSETEVVPFTPGVPRAALS